jgi:ATP-dependent RNA helicase DeaD
VRKTTETNPQPTASADEAELSETPVQAAPFRALNLSEPVMRAVIEAGFEAPTPIQEQAIPIMLTGQDLIGQAQTGTGKTAAFALPLAERLDPTQHYPQAIILLPTRELCIQVAQETHNLSKYRRLRVVPIYGGQPIDRQFRALSQGPQIVVGTPGRVLDHLRRGTLDLSRVKIVILDEADEMLNMGFLEDVEEILKEAPAERQTALFSATMPPRIAALARDYLKDPQRVTIESKRRTVAQVQQSYYEVVPSQKVEALARILDHETPGSTILFCRTRREVDELGEALQMRGYQAETLHGDMNQAARDRVMNRFRSGQADLLIATDVAARGLDIDQVTHVINYDIPWDVESYIHRIGRTGRAGRSGEAITLVSPRERYQLRQIERFINAPIRPARVPTAADIAARRRDLFKEKLRETLSSGSYDGHLMTVEELASEGDFDASQIAAAALQMLWQTQKGADEYDIAEAEAETERAEPGMTRLFLQIGRQDGIRPGDIVGAIANEAGVPGNAIGAIDIMDRSTFVEVPEADAPRVIEALSRTKLRGKRVFVDVARPRREEGENLGGFPPRREFERAPRGDFRGGRGGFGREDRFAPKSRAGGRKPAAAGRRKP